MIKRPQRGFTIVELLVVIVVIGILAAVTIVTFNGIQARAENTKTVSAVEAYATAAAIYKSDNGTYPSTGLNLYGCLGNTSLSESCGSSGSTACVSSAHVPGEGYPSGYTVTQPTLDKFKTVMNTLPEASKQRIDCGSGVTGNGIVYNSNDGTNAIFIFFLKNASPCPTPAGTALFYSAQSGSTLGCWITLS